MQIGCELNVNWPWIPRKLEKIRIGISLENWFICDYLRRYLHDYINLLLKEVTNTGAERELYIEALMRSLTAKEVEALELGRSVATLQAQLQHRDDQLQLKDEQLISKDEMLAQERERAQKVEREMAQRLLRERSAVQDILLKVGSQSVSKAGM